MQASCVRKVLEKYEALRRGASEQTCKAYAAYSSYKKDDVEVFVGLKQMGGHYEVSIIPHLLCFGRAEVYFISPRPVVVLANKWPKISSTRCPSWRRSCA